MNRRSDEATKTSHPIYTNTLIKLQIPNQNYINSYSYQWISQNNINNFTNCVLTRYDIIKIVKLNEYQCTPLDYGSFITGRVVITKDGVKQIIKQQKFGPVQTEPQITRFMNLGTGANARVIFNKNYSCDSKIQIVYNQSQNNKLHISVKAQQFNFDIKIQRNIRLPSNNSFFKFYDRQQDCLGISIYHQHSQFIDKIKHIRGLQHFGFYLKLLFESRQCRDAFLFELMEKLGIKIDQMSSQQPQFKIVLKPSLIVNAQQQQEIDMLIRNKTQHRIKQLDDQIFKILYQASQAGNCNQLSLDMADAEMLLSSTKKIDIFNNSLIKSTDFKGSERKKPSPYLSQINQNHLLNYACEQKSTNCARNLQIQAHHDEDNQQKNIHFKGSMLINNQNVLRNTITNLTNQVKSLMKQNRKLSQQNKKLKDQNMRLRFKQIKNLSQNHQNDRKYPIPPKGQKMLNQARNCTSGKKRSSMHPTPPFFHPNMFVKQDANTQKQQYRNQQQMLKNLKLSASGSTLINQIPNKFTERNMTVPITKFNYSSNKNLNFNQSVYKEGSCFQSNEPIHVINYKNNNNACNIVKSHIYIPQFTLGSSQVVNNRFTNSINFSNQINNRR